jgi:hypothetical protein
MPLNVTGNLDVSIRATEATAVAIGLASVQIAPSLPVNLAFGAGTGALKIQQVWTKSATATAAPVTYILSALVDDFGRSIPLAKVRGIVIANLSGTDGQTLLMGGATTNPWLAPFGDVSDKVVIRAGGVLVMAGPLLTGYAVTAGASDQLKLDPGAATIPFKIFFLGE